MFSTAVPEPGSLALMLGGLGVLGWRRHRRGRAR
ncbi:MAG: PEP-CTERM sorting domain-containing protein [Burkholderiales bacterium]|nr:PEP-CTERM sorting domain-containing protein [Burkholderiales bacterium]